jgi:general secretion pathway protein E/type IV pilus assembly protein PilB
LVSSTVEAVMAQRLVRRLCEHCKQPYRPLRDELPPDFPWEELNGGELFRPAGCRQCRNSGYSGRLGIYELLVTTEEVRRLAHENASSWDLKKAAVQNGMTTLRMDGWKKTVAGATSVDEVARVTKGDRMVTA